MGGGLGISFNILLNFFFPAASGAEDFGRL